jgi:hypothetical protein
MEMVWTSFDPEHPTWTVDELHRIYMEEVDKGEHPDFFWWIWSLEQSEILVRKDGKEEA